MAHHCETHDAPAWLDREAYPFKLRRLVHADGAISWVDEGPRDAPAIVLVHGNPSWSFMYRRQILDLRDRYRCVAVDHLGFGLSEKPPGASYHPADHARRLGAVLDALGLDEVHLVLHDWGGPIGMGWALDHPGRVRSLLILNTWMWSLGNDPQARRFSRTLSSWPAQVAIRRFDVFVRYLMPKTFPDRRQFKAVKDQYTGPFQNAADRAGVADFPRQLMAADEFLGSLWQRRDRVAGKPTRLVWALRDPVFRKTALERWQGLFPEAPVEKVPGVGHYVAEEMGSKLSPFVADHVAAVDS